MKKIILTGATGSIGNALLQECAHHQVETFIICRPDSPRVHFLPQGNLVHIIFADLAHLQQTQKELPTDADVFYHLGWTGTDKQSNRDDMTRQVQNIQYSLDAVELAYKCGCHTFIGAGSQAEYGRVEGLLQPDTPTHPDNGYGMAKLCAGQMSRVVAQRYGMKHIWTRTLSVYGPQDGARTMIMSVIHQLLRGKAPDCTLGEQMWDYLFAKDAGGMFFALGEKGIDGKIYCLGSGEAKPLREYIMTIQNEITRELTVNFGAVPYAPKQVMHLQADISDMERDTGYHCRYSFLEGIRETIQWCKENMDYWEGI